MTPDRRPSGRNEVGDTWPDFAVESVTPTDLRSIHRHPRFDPSALAVCWPSWIAARRTPAGAKGPSFALVACRHCRTRHYVG